MFNLKKVRSQFPLLKRKIGQNDLVYLDNAATTQKPMAVMLAMDNFYSQNNANIHRGIHTLSGEATVAYETVREQVAELIGLKPTVNKKALQSIIFTSGTTDSINMVAYSWGLKYVDEGDEIILSIMEHHSNLVPWQLLCSLKKARLKFIPLNPQGNFDLDAYEQLFTSKTKLVSVSAMSNVFGKLTPIEQMTTIAHNHGVPIMLDAAQAMAHEKIDVSKVDCDFMAFSAHKMLGPTGVGVLYGKPELLEIMPPFRGGGEMIKTVDLNQSTWADLPHKFEAGTMNIAGVVGYGVAIKYLNSLDRNALQQYEEKLTKYVLDQLRTIDGITIYGSDEGRCGVVSFNLDNVHCHDLAQYLDSCGIAIRAGHHCTQPLMKSLNVPAMARVSTYIYNTHEEINSLISAIKQAQKFFN